MNEFAPILTLFLIFGGGSVLNKMWSKYHDTRIEIARIKADQRPNYSGGGSREVDELREELDKTRRELQALRDTSMQYDISFDTALVRMETRMAHLERRAGQYVAEEATDPNSGSYVTLTGK